MPVSRILFGNLLLVISSAGETAAGHIVELLDYHFPEIIML